MTQLVLQIAEEIFSFNDNDSLSSTPNGQLCQFIYYFRYLIRYQILRITKKFHSKTCSWIFSAE